MQSIEIQDKRINKQKKFDLDHDLDKTRKKHQNEKLKEVFKPFFYFMSLIGFVIFMVYVIGGLTNDEKDWDTYQIYGEESLRSPKENGICSAELQGALKWELDADLANRICCKNSGAQTDSEEKYYFRDNVPDFERTLQDKVQEEADLIAGNRENCLKNAERTHGQNDALRCQSIGLTEDQKIYMQMKFYDVVHGKLLFTAPVDRSFQDFYDETHAHGWPSFRGQEVNWEVVRTIKSKNTDADEVITVDGVHLGHQIPDEEDRNRYCIDILCIGGHP